MTKNSSVSSFAHCMSQRVKSTLDRAIAFLYFHAVKDHNGASLKQIIADFESSGLSKPNITKLRAAITKDRRTTKVSKDQWRLKSDKMAEVEKEFQLNKCLGANQRNPKPLSGAYIDKKRFQALKKKTGKFDFTRLLQMLLELDVAFERDNLISVILLIRAILDHVPPIFGFETFAEVANSYAGTKSFKDSMLNLENSSRKITDSYLHTKIRSKESLPNRKQINFSNDLDVLLSEIVRIT